MFLFFNMNFELFSHRPNLSISVFHYFVCLSLPLASCQFNWKVSWDHLICKLVLYVNKNRLELSLCLNLNIYCTTNTKQNGFAVKVNVYQCYSPVINKSFYFSFKITVIQVMVVQGLKRGQLDLLVGTWRCFIVHPRCISGSNVPLQAGEDWVY